MQLFIRNKWVSFTGSSVVKDANEQDVMKVKGKFFSITRKKFIMDMEENLKYMVRNKFWTFFVKKAFVFDKDGKQIALVRRKFFSVHDHYYIESSLGNLEIRGNILGFDYHISVDGKEIGHIKRPYVQWTDTFNVTVNDPEDAAILVAMVIAIDNIQDQAKKENSR